MYTFVCISGDLSLQIATPFNIPVLEFFWRY